MRMPLVAAALMLSHASLQAARITPAPAPAKTTPQAVKALRQLQTEHFPVKGDTGPTSWSTGTYLYDPSGNIAVIGSQYFIYDANDRLTGANITNGVSTQQQGFWYDEYGNMNNRQYPGQAWISIGVDAGSNHVTGNSVQYDDAGNITNWTANGDAITYTYDGLSMMQQVTDTNGHNLMYIYTADNQRVWSFDYAGNSAHWRIRDLGGKVLRDFTQNNQGQWGEVKDYFYRNGLLLASSIPNTGAVTHFSLDHLGTPRLLTDQNGGKVAFHTYWPFGDEWTDGSPQESPAEVMKFTGHERDTDLTGAGGSLDYMHARFLATGTNRFMSVDAMKGDPGDPQSLNRYVYGRNNPMKLLDLDGKSYLVFNRATQTLTLYSRAGAYVGSWSASNKADSSAKIDPLHGQYKFMDRKSPHFHPGKTQTLKEKGEAVLDKKGKPVKIPVDSAKGSYGAGGIFRLNDFSDSQGAHAGVGVHAGKVGVTSPGGLTGWETPTHGCVRTTPEAVQQITDTAKTDPLTSLYALNGNSSAEAGYWVPSTVAPTPSTVNWMLFGTATAVATDQVSDGDDPQDR